MSKKNNVNSFISILLIFLLSPLQTVAQINITGVVRDKQTGEILDNVSVILEGTTHGCITNNMGEFSIAVNDGDILSVSFLGYKKFSQLINKNTSSHLSIKLEPSDYELHEIIIKPKKEKYSKKRNPAVEFVENVIKRKNDGKLKDKDYYSYQKY